MVIQLIEAIVTNSLHDAVSSVDLSGNGNIGAATVTRLLELYPNSTTLTLFHTSSNLTLRDLSSILEGKTDIKLHHSELFSAAFVDTAGPWDDEQYVGSLATFPNRAAPAGTLNDILFLSTREEIAKEAHPLRLKCGGLKWSELLSQSDFNVARSHRDDACSYITNIPLDVTFFHTSIPLDDAFLNPLRLTDWLRRLLWYFVTNIATNDRRSLRRGHASLGCALALAMDTELN